MEPNYMSADNARRQAAGGGEGGGGKVGKSVGKGDRGNETAATPNNSTCCGPKGKTNSRNVQI